MCKYVLLCDIQMSSVWMRLALDNGMAFFVTWVVTKYLNFKRNYVALEMWMVPKTQCWVSWLWHPYNQACEFSVFNICSLLKVQVNLSILFTIVPYEINSLFFLLCPCFGNLVRITISHYSVRVHHKKTWPKYICVSLTFR